MVQPCDAAVAPRVFGLPLSVEEYERRVRRDAIVRAERAAGVRGGALDLEEVDLRREETSRLLERHAELLAVRAPLLPELHKHGFGRLWVCQIHAREKVVLVSEGKHGGRVGGKELEAEQQRGERSSTGAAVPASA